MFSQRPNPNGDAAGSDALVALLRQASLSLGRLMELTQAVAELEDPVSLGFCPNQMKNLCKTIEKGRAKIESRISVLGRPGASNSEPSTDSSPPVDFDSPSAFLAQYRSCCRRLCRALGEAREAPDGSTVAVLSEIILKLEKQLWLIDNPQHVPGTEPYRSVSLFLTC